MHRGSSARPTRRDEPHRPRFEGGRPRPRRRAPSTVPAPVAAVVLLTLGAFLAASAGPAVAQREPPQVSPPEPGREAATVFTGERWQTASPVSQGLDAAELARGIDAVGGLPGARSLLVVRHGRIVAERSFAGGDLNRTPHNVKSASKSLLSALVGIALEEGWIAGVESPVGELLPGYAAGLGAEKKRITLADLLTMRAGLASTSGEHFGAWVASDDWAAAALARPLETTPGEGFVYSTGSSHLVSAILAETSGESTLELLRRHLARPLGMEIHSWQRSPEGYHFGGNNLELTPRDLARFGQLYLQGGTWNGRRVVPAAWIEASTRRHAVGWPDRYGAYGYLWWRPPDDPWDSFAAVGYGGQFLYVVPELDMLLVMTSTHEGKGADWDRKAFRIFREQVFGAAR